jgi:post-segregation antitoxin (ccd killing protein)
MRSTAARTKRNRKQSVNLSLDAGVLKEARKWTENLSAEVEQFLGSMVQEKKAEHEAALALRRAAALQEKAFVEKYGSLADEFSTL